MLLRVFPHDGSAKFSIEIAKSATVDELRDMIQGKMDDQIDLKDFRLMVNGKALETVGDDGTALKLYSDYRIRGNEHVQLFKKVDAADLRDTDGTSEPTGSRFATADNVKAIEDVELREAVEKIVKEDDKPPAATEENKENEDGTETEKKEQGGQTEEEEEWGACDKCKRNPGRKCKQCNCHACGISADSDKTIICDGYSEGYYCERPFHMYCLDPPLENVPDDMEWFCPKCAKERTDREKKTLTIGKAPSKSKAQAQQASARTEKQWGGGFSCAGVSEKCTVVEKNHRGAVPGVEVGQSWKYRIGVSQDGIHRPLQAGIHSNGQVGALSLVASGGYQDESDKGDEIIYTGEGGRSFEGNTRSSEQCKDQELKRGNLGLATTCFGSFTNPTNKGGDAGENWKKSKPIRIVRGTSAHKNKKIRSESPYEPEEGYRYDGIYKMVRFWREKSDKHGFYVWQFLLRRDDAAPAPWTDKGKERIEKLGLKMVFPPDYDATLAAKEGKDAARKSDMGLSGAGGKRMVAEDSPGSALRPAKASKLTYRLSDECLQRIADDATANGKRWQTCLDVLDSTGERMQLIEAFQREFACCVCLSLLEQPTTFPCTHNICGDCLPHLRKSEEKLCPSCRAPLPDEDQLVVNENLNFVLNYVHWKPVI